jgi:hypothetical protein
MSLSKRHLSILAFVLTVLAGAVALVTSGAVTLYVKVDGVEAPVEAPVEAVPALADPIQVPSEATAETQVVDEASDAPSADVAVEASGG